VVTTPQIIKPFGKFRHGCAEYVVMLKLILHSARGCGLDILQSGRELFLALSLLVCSGDQKYALGFQSTLG